MSAPTSAQVREALADAVGVVLGIVSGRLTSEDEADRIMARLVDAGLVSPDGCIYESALAPPPVEDAAVEDALATLDPTTEATLRAALAAKDAGCRACSGDGLTHLPEPEPRFCECALGDALSKAEDAEARLAAKDAEIESAKRGEAVAIQQRNEARDAEVEAKAQLAAKDAEIERQREGLEWWRKEIDCRPKRSTYDKVKAERDALKAQLAAAEAANPVQAEHLRLLREDLSALTERLAGAVRDEYGGRLSDDWTAMDLLDKLIADRAVAENRGFRKAAEWLAKEGHSLRWDDKTIAAIHAEADRREGRE